MQTLSRDARGFVEGIVGYLRREEKDSPAVGKVKILLQRVSAAAREEKQAIIESSVALTMREKEQVADFLARALGHPVHLSVRVKPELFAGFQIRVGDWIVDTSLAHQLDALKQRLLE